MIAVTAAWLSLGTRWALGVRFFPSFVIAMTTASIIAGAAAAGMMMLSRRLAREREERQVFLIYAREDLETARKLTAALREHGFRPWLDVEEIMPGQVWQKAVTRAIEQSAAALVLVSAHLQKKGFVQEELKVALETLQEREEGLSPVIPVRLDDSEVPERLSHVQWVDMSEQRGMERLVSGLRRIVKSGAANGASHGN